MKLDIQSLLKEMTLEEKAGLCSGADFWHTKAVERLGLPAVMVSDGPHGLRKQAEESDHLGLNRSVPAVCFPTGAALASSFDRALLRTLGETLGEEARAEGIHTLLGPAINIKRSPLCGRNFEYYSEDPFLAGELSVSYVNGVQSRQVGVSVKHYAANNQEERRMSVDAVVSERALREIYLAAFEKTVRQARPWTMMCAYNRVNGTYCCENPWLLDELLRGQWGFDGIVMTDWGAMNRRAESLRAGLELEMPASGGLTDRQIVKAVESGALAQEVLDTAVERLLRWIEKGLQDAPAAPYDREAHHAIARKTACECAVLLKNEGGLLPLSKAARVAFIGSFAAAPRFQGGGSSHINCFKVTTALEAAKGLAVEYAPGWAEDGVTADAALAAGAVRAAKDAEVAVIFAGLPDSYESEGYDRTHMEMPDCQNELIRAVAAAQPNTVVVLHNGSPVTMPWLAQAPAVLELYLGGQAAGEAAVDLLFGDASPGGHLAETFPLRLEDTPAYLNFPGDGEQVVYAEDVYVGYRWYDSRTMPVLFPFGHGLTYTTFSLERLRLSASSMKPGEVLQVEATLRNTGARAGKQVVQLYLAPPADARRPARELKGFEKVSLEPGEAQKITFRLEGGAFAHYDEHLHDWRVEGGRYTLELGFSSRELPLSAQVEVASPPLPLEWTDHTTIGDVIAAGKQAALGTYLTTVGKALGVDGSGEGGASNPALASAMLGNLPVHSIPSFAEVPDDFLETIRRSMME
uniref:Glycoside hydrolase family 3 protein n=1 Tax=termite gut metagenome TaxID=433724 RepID=S0DEM6_9ZZZZ